MLFPDRGGSVFVITESQQFRVSLRFAQEFPAPEIASRLRIAEGKGQHLENEGVAMDADLSKSWCGSTLARARRVLGGFLRLMYGLRAARRW